MPAPAYTIAHGTGTLITEAKISTRVDGFDEGSFEAHSASETTFAKGFVMPGYAGLYIQSVDSKLDGLADDGVTTEWMHDIRAIGLRDGVARLINSEAEDSEDGFDTGSEEWIVPAAQASTYLTYGRAHSNHANLKCVNPKEKRSPISAYKIISLGFKGIKSGSKPIREKVDTLSRDVSRQNFIVTLPGGDANPHNWNLLLSQPSLQRSYLSTNLPNTTLVGAPGYGVGGFPAQYTVGFSASDDTLTWSWPNGVILAALNYDIIPGTTICFVTEYWLNRQKINLG